MKPRDRVLTALSHREPDRVPHNLRLTRKLRERLRAEHGDGTEIDEGQYFDHDVRYVRIEIPKPPDGVAEPDWRPEPTAEQLAACTEQTRALQQRGYAVCGAYHAGIYEHLKKCYGDVEALTLPYTDPARLERELDWITNFKLRIALGYANSGVDIVWIGDDLGAQRSLIMSPEHYRAFYRPRHAHTVEQLRRVRPDIKIAFHCCGHVTPLVGDLIEVGIDILEAVQAETMDIGLLKREFGRKICFWGAVGAQSVLARTSPEQVMAGVKRTLEIMAPGGGYIAAPCHTLTEEVPWASILAFHEAIRRYGAYAISADTPALAGRAHAVQTPR